MTHYIADLACPPHLLPPSGYIDLPQIYNEPIAANHYKSGFHSWYENQLGYKTTWNSANGGPLGYYDANQFFTIEMFSIGVSVNAIPAIPPVAAAIAMAQKGIEISYGHIDGEGYNVPQEYERAGVYLYNNYDQKWDWGDTGKERNSQSQIVSGGLTYKHYYDKVEELLNWGVYYTACALKWTMNEVIKKNNYQTIDADKWAKTHYENLDSEAVPIPNPDKDHINEVNDAYYDSGFYVTFESMALLAPTLALVVIPIILGIVVDKKSKVITV